MIKTIELQVRDNETYEVLSDMFLTHEQKSFFEGLPLYYEHVNLEVESKDGNIIVHRATSFSDDVNINLTHDDVADWFYHSCSNTPTIIQKL